MTQLLERIDRQEASAMGLDLCAAIYETGNSYDGLTNFVLGLVSGTEADDVSEENLRVAIAASFLVTAYMCNDIVDDRYEDFVGDLNAVLAEINF